MLHTEYHGTPISAPSSTTRRERGAAQSDRAHAAHEAHKRPAYLPPCPSSAVLLSRACGHHQAALIKCHNALCPDCERERAARIRDKWESTLAALPELKMLTLTIANGPDLDERIDTIRTARRALLDLRIGRNNRARIRRDVEKQIGRALKAKRIDQAKADKWCEEAERWLTTAARYERRFGKSPKVRQRIKGLSSMEITHGAGGWHVHLHCIVSMRYMPQVILQTLWHMATHGAGHITHIRKIDDAGAGLAEAMKYCTKPGNIPDELGPTVIAALKGVRRLTRIGNIKPIEPDPLPCPGCDRPACECGSLYAGMVSARDIGLDLNNPEGGAFITRIYDAGFSYDARIKLHRDAKAHLTWTATSLAGSELLLSTQSHSVSREGGSSPPTGPPLSDYDDRHDSQAVIEGAR